MTHPINRMDDTVHQRVRLGILAALRPLKSCDFTFLRDEMQLTDGNLSRHLQVLEDAGYVKINKSFEGKKPRTMLGITNEGRKALEREVTALRDLIAGFDA